MKKSIDFKVVISWSVILFVVAAQVINVLEKNPDTSDQKTDWGFIVNQMGLLMTILLRMLEVQSIRRENHRSAREFVSDYTKLSRKNEITEILLALPGQQQIYDAKQQHVLDPQYFNLLSLLLFAGLAVDTFFVTGFLSAASTGIFLIIDYRASRRLDQHQGALREAHAVIQDFQQQINAEIVERDEKKRLALEEKIEKLQTHQSTQEELRAPQMTQSDNAFGFFDQVSDFFRSIIPRLEDDESDGPSVS